MTPLEVLALLRGLGELFGLGEQLVQAAQQTHPVLRPPPITPERAAIDAGIDETLADRMRRSQR